jgi:hypothetical protein
MSVIEKVLSFGKDILLIAERLDSLSKAVGKLADRVEDQERRLIRIEALIEFGMKTRGSSVERDVSSASVPPYLPPPDL